MSSKGSLQHNTGAPWYVGPNGATRQTRHEAQRFARQIVESDTYRNKLKDRADAGKLDPAVEQMLWHYAYGKPVEQIEMTVTPGVLDLSTLTLDQLQENARAVSDQIEQMKELQGVIDAHENVIDASVVAPKPSSAPLDDVEPETPETLH